MLLLADTALGQTLALLVTFLGVGVLVNVLVLYIVAQVLGERKQNREYRARRDSFESPGHPPAAGRNSGR